MKHCICGIVMAVSFFMAIGFIGGLVNDTVTTGQAVIGCLASITAFCIAGRIGGVIE